MSAEAHFLTAAESREKKGGAPAPWSGIKDAKPEALGVAPLTRRARADVSLFEAGCGGLGWKLHPLWVSWK